MCPYIRVSVSRPTLSRVLIAQQESISCCLYNTRTGKYHGNLWHICPHESVTTSLPRDGVGTVRQSLRGSSRSICQNPSAPASWQHPLLPSLIPLLPAGLGNKECLLRYEESWQGKERTWRYISMGVHLHSAWGHRWQAADRRDQRGVARFILSFCHLVLPLPLSSLQTMNSWAKTELQPPLWWNVDAGWQRTVTVGKNWNGMWRRTQWWSPQQGWFW